MSETHKLSLRGGRKDASSAILVMHGGQESSRMPTSPWQRSYVRMFDLYYGLKKGSRSCAVYLLRHRVRGWNADGGVPDPVSDARWAVDRITHDHPGVPLALLGHSMGGRTAFAIADHPAVVGVCGLAPWLPEHEPVVDVRPDQQFVIAHGLQDRMTSAALSLAYAARLREAGTRAARFELTDGRHALLDQPSLWRRFAVQTTLAFVGARPMPDGVARAFEGAGSQGLSDNLESFNSAT